MLDLQSRLCCIDNNLGSYVLVRAESGLDTEWRKSSENEGFVQKMIPVPQFDYSFVVWLRRRMQNTKVQWRVTPRGSFVK